MTDEQSTRAGELYDELAKKRPLIGRDESCRSLARWVCERLVELQDENASLRAEVRRMRDIVGPGPCR